MRYAVREKLFSIGDDFWITDEGGDKAFLVDGKVLRLRQTLEICDPDGRVLVTVRKKLIAMHESMEIEEDGALVATVRKALISPLRHRSTVELADGSQLDVTGSILDKEFEITAGGEVLARISRAWFRIRDTYGVEVEPGQDDVLFLAIAVALDRIQHDDDVARSPVTRRTRPWFTARTGVQTGQAQSSRPARGGPAAPGGGNSTRRVNASALGPCARSCRTRSSASAGVGTVPRAIHHSAVYASVIRSNHCLRRASTRRWVSEYTNAASASGVSQTDMFMMTPALPA